MVTLVTPVELGMLNDIDGNYLTKGCLKKKVSINEKEFKDLQETMNPSGSGFFKPVPDIKVDFQTTQTS